MPPQLVLPSAQQIPLELLSPVEQQMPLELLVPVGQHRPAEQELPLQALPQVPQFALLVCRSTQAPPQSVVPAGQRHVPF